MRIAVWGNFGVGNIGNDCTLQAIATSLRARIPKAQITAVCSEPEDVRRYLGIDAIEFRMSNAKNTDSMAYRALRRGVAEPKAFLRAAKFLRGAAALIVAGTGIITDTGERTFGLPFELLRWCLAARAVGTKVMFVSIGVERIESSLTRLFLRQALSIAVYRSYRDAQSQKRLLELGFPVAGDVVYPDLAFGLPVPVPEVIDDTGRPIAVVGVWDYPQHKQSGIQYNQYISFLVDTIEWLMDGGYRVRVIIGDQRYDERVRVDLRAAMERKRPLSDAEYLDPPAHSLEMLQRQILNARVVIATRFHNVVLSLLQGTPVLALSYEHKIDVLLRDFGLGDFVQSVWQSDFAMLKRQFREIEQRHDALSSGIRQRTATYLTSLTEQYDRISDILSD